MFNPSFKITDLNCEACVKLSVGALRKISGLTSVRIDPASGKVEISADKEIAWEEIVNALAPIGKHAQLL